MWISDTEYNILDYRKYKVIDVVIKDLRVQRRSQVQNRVYPERALKLFISVKYYLNPRNKCFTILCKDYLEYVKSSTILLYKT